VPINSDGPPIALAGSARDQALMLTVDVPPQGCVVLRVEPAA
jgi:hypothetical protein